VVLLDRNVRDRSCPFAEQRRTSNPTATFPQILPLRQSRSAFDSWTVQLRIVMSAEVTTADGPMPSTVRMVFQVPGKGKR
jgi:hypothetical protein